ASMGLPAIPAGGAVSAAACRRQCRHGPAARADRCAGPVSLVAQSDVSRAPDLPRGPCVDLRVVVRADPFGRPRLLVPTPRAARRGAARTTLRRRIRRLQVSREAMGSRNPLAIPGLYLDRCYVSDL